MGDSHRIFRHLSLLHARGKGSSSQSSESTPAASSSSGSSRLSRRLRFSRTSGGTRQESPERLRPISPNPNDTIRDDESQAGTLRSILSFADSDDSNGSENTIELERVPQNGRPGTSRPDAFAFMFDALLDSEKKRATNRGPWFPGVTERASAKPTTTTGLPSGLADLKDLIEALGNAFSGPGGDLDDLLRMSQADDESRRSPANWEPIHFASQKGSLNVIRAILDKGGSVNPKDSSNRTPLHYASQQGHTDVCRLLIERGADINAAANRGVTPLLLASLRGNAEVLKLLLSKGANIEARVRDGSTSLLLAVWGGSQKNNDNLSETVQILLEAGADPNAADENGVTPIMAAALWNGTTFARLLLTHGANPNTRDFRNRSPVAMAASENDPEMLRLLLQHGADCTGVDHRKWTALHLSAQHDTRNTLEVVKLLLERNVIDVNAVEERGATALYLAVQAGRADVVQVLLAAGANPNAVTVSDVSVVERAVLSGNLMLVDLILDAGADPHRVDKRGLGLLHVAVMGENVDIVRRVLQTGIDTELKTTDDKKLRPMQLAVQNDNEQIALLLLEYGAHP